MVNKNKSFMEDIIGGVAKKEKETTSKTVSEKKEDIEVVKEDDKTEEIDTPKLILEKKTTEKPKIKNTHILMPETKYNDISKVAKKYGYSTSELMNIMLDFAMDNMVLK